MTNSKTSYNKLPLLAVHNFCSLPLLLSLSSHLTSFRSSHEKVEHGRLSYQGPFHSFHDRGMSSFEHGPSLHGLRLQKTSLHKIRQRQNAYQRRQVIWATVRWSDGYQITNEGPINVPKPWPGVTLCGLPPPQPHPKPQLRS
jgi:hypothetical protein